MENKTSAEFRNTYFGLIQPQISQFEKKRNAVLGAGIETLFLVIPFLAHLVYLLTSGTRKSFFHLDAGLVQLLLFFLVAYAFFYPFNRMIKGYREYKSSYKESVISVIFKSIAPSLSYEAFHHVSQEMFNSSLIFQKRPDRFTGEDYLSGKIKNTSIEFSEICAEYQKTVYDSKGRPRTKWVTIFQGLFFSADFNKQISGETFVYPDLSEKWLGKYAHFLQDFLKPAEFLVKLEDPLFEKEFVVYSSSQIEARYCLSPQIMQGLVTLKKMLNQSFCVSFLGTRIHIAIPRMMNSFEPPLFKSSISCEQVEELWKLITALTSIVDLVDLNTRIWMKK